MIAVKFRLVIQVPVATLTKLHLAMLITMTSLSAASPTSDVASCRAGLLVTPESLTLWYSDHLPARAAVE